MNDYFSFLESISTPDEILKYVSGFTFDLAGSKELRTKGEPPLPSLQNIFKNKTGTCSNLSYFIVKSINFLDKKFAAFGLYYDWITKLREDTGELDKKLVSIATYKIPIWHEDDKVFTSDFDGLDVSSIRRIGPYNNYQELHTHWFKKSKKGIEKLFPGRDPSFGISIVDVRVANDSRIFEALKFFGVDNLDYWYRRVYKKLDDKFPMRMK